MRLKKTRQTYECCCRSGYEWLSIADQSGLSSTRSGTVQSALLPFAPVTVACTVIRESGSSPLWTVFQNGCPILKASAVNTLDGALELVHVEWRSVADDICQAACVGLLGQLVAEADRQGQKVVRALIWDQEPSLPTAGLRSAGFNTVAALQAWTAPMQSPFRDRPTAKIQRWPLTDGRPGLQHKSILKLLQDCITGSHDLTSFSPPVPATLLKTWQSLDQPELITASIDGCNVGLAALSQDKDRQLTTLEYIGVSVRSRRLGFGRQLLAAARTKAGPFRTSNLVAYCDCDNAPGMQLYQTSGFVAGKIGHIWIRSI